ncbi:hypothetical protein D9M70_473410 [compost metagenome]
MADARLHALGQGQGAGQVAAEDGRREAELRIVGQRQQLLVALAAQQHRHRAKGFLAVQTHVRGDAVQQHRLHHAAFDLATGQQHGALVQGVLHQANDALAGTGIDQRPQHRLARQAGAQAGHLARQA